MLGLDIGVWCQVAGGSALLGGGGEGDVRLDEGDVRLDESDVREDGA